jgi:hypothetical protein
MRSWLLASSIVVVMAQSSACGLASNEPLPTVRTPALFQEPEACVPWPPGPDMLPPEHKPSDPRVCLALPWRGGGLPLHITIIDGRVADFEIYEPCSGRQFTIPTSARDCIRKSLETWRYATWPTCPGQRSRTMDFVYLEPLRRDARMVAAASPAPCEVSGGIE